MHTSQGSYTLFSKKTSQFVSETTSLHRRMGVHWVFSDIRLALAMLLLSVVLKIVYSMWILPSITYFKIKRNGLSGPSPRFPLGNITDMVAHSKKNDDPSSSSCDSNIMSHHIHSKVFPYFAQWQQSHG